MTDKKTPAQEAEVENATLLKDPRQAAVRVGRLNRRQERGVLVTELSTSIDGISETETSWPAS